MKLIHYKGLYFVLMYCALLIGLGIYNDAHAGCNHYYGGTVVCQGPDGYTSVQNNYSGGASFSRDNRGNTASTNRYSGGYVGVTAPTGVAPSTTGLPRLGDTSTPHMDALYGR